MVLRGVMRRAIRLHEARTEAEVVQEKRQDRHSGLRLQEALRSRMMRSPVGQWGATVGCGAEERERRCFLSIQCDD